MLIYAVSASTWVAGPAEQSLWLSGQAADEVSAAGPASNEMGNAALVLGSSAFSQDGATLLIKCIKIHMLENLSTMQLAGTVIARR